MGENKTRLVGGLLRHLAQSGQQQCRAACSRVLERGGGRRFIPSKTFHEQLQPRSLGVSMKRAAAAFLSAADSALRPCALTQNNHATIFVPVAKNEGKLAMVVIMRKRRGINSSAILQFLLLMALECGENVFLFEECFHVRNTFIANTIPDNSL